MLTCFRSSPDGLLNFAIYVRSVSRQQQFYTLRGTWRVATDRDIEYVIKGFAPRELVTPLYAYFPASAAQVSRYLQSTIEGGVPRSVGAPLLRMVNRFDEKVQEAFQKHSTQFAKMHDTVSDETEKLVFTLEDLACKTLGIEEEQLDAATLCAAHRVICRNQVIIERDKTSPFSNHYLVQPKRISRALNYVTHFVHHHQNALVRAAHGEKLPTQTTLPAFIRKAQRLIRQSRKARSPTIMGSVGPTAARFQPGEDENPMTFRKERTERLNTYDRMIVEFIQLWALPTEEMDTSALRSVGSHILRATGMYGALELSMGAAPLFLQEIGAITPWENLRLLDQSIALPGHGITSKSDAAWADVQQACENLISEGVRDTMQNARTDWGDLPVYCIDNPDAQEIDDGVSLERIPDSDDTFWIRTHIANPSAFIDSKHSIMEYAASRVQTLYTPERTYPMLPDSLTKGHFSLAPNRPTLTFSAKMNLKGEVLETDVSNGTVRNVVYITHDKLRSLFEPERQGSTLTLAVGGEFQKESPRKYMRETLSPEDEDTFHTLRKLMLAFREHRRKNGAMEWPQPINTSVSMTAGLEPLPPREMPIPELHSWVGDPIIRLHHRDLDPHEVPDLSKRDLVSMLMNLACWVSATWCAERNIPVVYDGTHYHPEYPQLTNSNIAEFGGQNWFELAAPKGMSSSTPSHHVPLGLDAYVKSTSPLRRYTDLLAHYQIEAALRYEKEHGRRLDATTDESILPFSRDDVDNYITSSHWKRNRLQNIDRGSKQFWGCMLLFRAFYFGECRLPEKFNCLIHKPYNIITSRDTQAFVGVITSLGIRCQILAPVAMSEIDVLSVVEAKIVQVDLSRLIVIMEATQMVKPFERVGEWR